jgi:transposase-like protein
LGKEGKMKKRYTQERKREILDYIKDKGITLEEGARNFEIPSGTVYRWSRSKYRAKIYGQEQEGLAQEKKGEEEESTGLPEEIQKIIIEFKKENPGAGLKRIDQELRGKYFLVIPRKRVREVLKREGLLNEEREVAEGEGKGQRRFEASAPGELWQMDVTNVYVKGVPVLYLVVILDDHSRYCLAAELREEMSSDTMIEVMHAVIERHGKPRKLLTDQGRSFYTWSMEQTKFQEYLDGLGVEHIVSEPHSPQTAGLC